MSGICHHLEAIHLDHCNRINDLGLISLLEQNMVSSTRIALERSIAPPESFDLCPSVSLTTRRASSPPTLETDVFISSSDLPEKRKAPRTREALCLSGEIRFSEVTLVDQSVECHLEDTQTHDSWEIEENDESYGGPKIVSFSECVQITDSSLYQLAQSAPNLLHLRCKGCPFVTDKGISVLLQGTSLLRTLVAARCILLSDECLLALASSPSCKTLTRLDVSHCDSVTDYGVCQVLMNCPNLTALDIGYCKNITDKSLDELQKHSSILQNLRELFITNNQLQSLSIPFLKGAHRLTKLFASCNSLSVIPDEIGNLTSLRCLYLYQTQVSWSHLITETPGSPASLD